MVILKICAIAVAGVIIISLIKMYKPEFTTEIVLCVSIILLYFIVDSIRYGFTYFTKLYDQLSYGKEYFPVIIKALAIAYVTEFASAICEDAGEKAIAGKIQLAGKIAIFFAAVPVFASLISLLESII